ncbi:IS1182 family transposase [Enterococcus sp. DIV0756]|uniref:IS1182 family transposase n=1 Tax=Enterococcus sp. DIV0756 TaxID=2774636 RepID=UPI003F2728BD
MLKRQEELVLSTHTELYDILIPEDHELRLILELTDFEFVYEELKDTYCLVDGRNAIDPIRMFKYLLLKVIYKMSDRDLVKRTKTDLAFKFFLGMAPEEEVINPSSLTKFRRQRLKDKNLLDLLVAKSVQIAVDQDVLKSNTLIVDATHTVSRFNKKSPVEILRNYSKNLRNTAYGLDDELKAKLPSKTTITDLDAEKNYTQEVIQIIEKQPYVRIPAVAEALNMLKEKLDDINVASVESFDEDARIGHKSADTSYLGFKTHLSMTIERLITAAVITSGEKGDGPYLQELIEKSEANGVDVKAVLGDRAYSGKENIDYTEANEIELYSRLNPQISNGAPRKHWDYNKDAERFVCPAGHLATRKARTGKKNQNSNQSMTYYFDIEKCKVCPFSEGCYKPNAKSKTYRVTILSDTHLAQKEFQETEHFKEKIKDRYMIEAKNDELKNRHGYNVSQANGLLGMDIQGATTIFAVNLKRIIKLRQEK